MTVTMNPFSSKTGTTLRKREEYAILSGDSKGEWLRIHWRADVPQSKRERGDLLADVTP